MKIERCSKCGHYIVGDTHCCPPAWLVRRVDDTEYQEVYDYNIGDAVEKFCEKNYSEWEFPKQIDILAGPIIGAWQKFHVDVELAPVFNVSEL